MFNYMYSNHDIEKMIKMKNIIKRRNPSINEVNDLIIKTYDRFFENLSFRDEQENVYSTEEVNQLLNQHF